jgi:hypothetical protein
VPMKDDALSIWRTSGEAIESTSCLEGSLNGRRSSERVTVAGARNTAVLRPQNLSVSAAHNS